MNKIENGIKIELTATEVLAREAEEKESQEQQDKTQWIRDRKAAYPSVEDQLDLIYHTTLTNWKTTIKAIKDKYPKWQA